MTCTFVSPNTIICTTAKFGRLHVGNRYIYVDFHPYFGPVFSWDMNGTKEVDVHTDKEFSDRVWAEYRKWRDRNQVN